MYYNIALEVQKMKAISIVLIVASFLILVMGIFSIAISSRYSGNTGKISRVNGIGQMILGIYGGTLAILYQFASMSKNLMLLLFAVGVIVISIVQVAYRKKIQ